MGSGIITKSNNTHAKPEHFFNAFEHCLNNQMTKNMALVMARGFSKRGMPDAQDGCVHYAYALSMLIRKGG